MRTITLSHAIAVCLFFIPIVCMEQDDSSGTSEDKTPFSFQSVAHSIAQLAVDSRNLVLYSAYQLHNKYNDVLALRDHVIRNMRKIDADRFPQKESVIQHFAKSRDSRIIRDLYETYDRKQAAIAFAKKRFDVLLESIDKYVQRYFNDFL